MKSYSGLFSRPIKRVLIIAVLAVFTGIGSSKAIEAQKSVRLVKDTQTACVVGSDMLACAEKKASKGNSFLSKILKSETIQNIIKKEDSTQKNNGSQPNSSSQTTSNTVSNTSSTANVVSPTPTLPAQQPTSYPTPTNQQIQIITPTQSYPTPTQTPSPTQVVTRLHVTSCGWYDLYYCRTNNQTYNYTRLRVKRSDTGEVLHASTLNSGGGYFTGFPINTKLDVILLPPTDRPDQCGDIKTIEFLSYHLYLNVELIIRPSGSSPCITS